CRARGSPRGRHVRLRLRTHRPSHRAGRARRGRGARAGGLARRRIAWERIGRGLSARGGVSYGARMATQLASVGVLRCDGAARGNPGPGAAAYVLFDPSGSEVDARGEYLGSVTNNVAEYRGL